ncbi:MAG: TIGR03619 family F420-dependent LLM class oxidoreductase [Candidatus Binatus sp.]
MKFAVAIRNMGPQSDRSTIRACARIAEQAGFDALFVSDHLCIPPDQTEGSGGRYLDVLATLAFIAGATEKIRLGVSVLVVPYRPAVLTAKQVATIQELSGERMILGVGVGWMKPEFAALGADIRQRGAVTDETLSVIHHLFSADVPGAYDGPLVKFPSFVFLPRPKCPPIWIGGNGAAAINRALKFGDGWHPMLPASELKAKVEELLARSRATGRALPEIIVRRGLRLDDIAGARAKVAAEREAGATYFILDLGRYPNEQSFGASVETFMAKVAN